jgi:hypothetical protein
LKKARELISTGQYDGIIAAISSLHGEASGRTRDLAYYALLETVGMVRGDASISMLSGHAQSEMIVEVFDATIKRITASLH